MGKIAANRTNVPRRSPPQHDLRGLGGSDAHYLSPQWFLTCATAFDDTITSTAELVEALHYGTYRPLELPPLPL